MMPGNGRVVFDPSLRFLDVPIDFLMFSVAVVMAIVLTAGGLR